MRHRWILITMTMTNLPGTLEHIGNQSFYTHTCSRWSGWNIHEHVHIHVHTLTYETMSWLAARMPGVDAFRIPFGYLSRED